MARKKEIVNPKRGERLHKLLIENDIRQQDFADRIGYTKQHLSLIITGKRNLTADAAQRIAQMFPPTRFEWLMGFDDFRTPDEMKLYPAVKILWEKRQREKAASTFLKTFGLSFEFSFDIENELKEKNIEECTDTEIDKAVEYVAKKLESEQAYVLKNLSGDTLFYCSREERQHFIDDLCEYAEFKLNKMIERAAQNGKT